MVSNIKSNPAKRVTDPEKVLNWLRSRFRKAGVHNHVYDNYAEREGFLIVPVYLSSRLDAYEAAKLMVKVQGEWNHRKTRGHLQLFLNPASSPGIFKPMTLPAKRIKSAARRTAVGNGKH